MAGGINPFGFAVSAPQPAPRAPIDLPSAPFGFAPPPSKWEQTAAILNEYNPIDAFWRLYNSDMAKGGAITDQNIEDGMMVGGTVMGGGAMIPKPANALNMGIRAYHGSRDKSPSIKAWHTTEKPFNSYDWSLLGSTTRPNVEGTGAEEWALDLARVGPWSSEKKIDLGYGISMPVLVGGEGKAFKSLDELHREIAEAGGPEKFRQDMVYQGFGHLKVADEEFGGTSYVSLTPETFTVDDNLISIVRKYGIAGASAMLGYNLLESVNPAQADELKRIEAGK